jgi:hypothetical protein
VWHSPRKHKDSPVASFRTKSVAKKPPAKKAATKRQGRLKNDLSDSKDDEPPINPLSDSEMEDSLREYSDSEDSLNDTTL